MNVNFSERDCSTDNGFQFDMPEMVALTAVCNDCGFEWTMMTQRYEHNKWFRNPSREEWEKLEREEFMAGMRCYPCKCSSS